MIRGAGMHRINREARINHVNPALHPEPGPTGEIRPHGGEIAWSIRVMRRIWGPIEYQKLHVGRILRIEFRKHA